MKLRVLAAIVAALTLTAGTATAQTRPATPAAAPAMPVVDKNHASYAFGWVLGQDLIESGDPFDIATVIRGVQDAYAKKQPAYTQEQLEKAYVGTQQRRQARMAEAMRKAASDNEAQSAGFVAKYKEQTGVVSLPNGIMYRVLRPGAGAKPNANSQVELVVQSFLAAVGVPTTGEQPMGPVKLSEIPIPALKDTLPLMQQGTLWEVLIPPGRAGPGNPQLAKQAMLVRVALASVK